MKPNNPETISISESKIVNAVAQLFRKKGYKYILKEVQFFEKYVDLIALNNPDEEIFAIEAKVNSTSRAFIQAKRYMHLADFVFVAILKNGSNKRAISLAKETGIGLILVNRSINGEFYAEVELNPNHKNIRNDIISNYILNLSNGEFNYV